jgi:hypothetical protein
MDSAEWQVPKIGLLECDFVYLVNRPTEEHLLRDDQVDLLCQWFKVKHEDSGFATKELAVAFRAISDFMTLRND